MIAGVPSYTLEQRASRWSAENIKIGVPLVRATRNHLNFLDMINDNPQVTEERLLSKAIKRYETLWLPLLASQGFTVEPMAAPLDIAWIWYIHLLAPQEYTKDCITVTSRVLNHRVMAKAEYAESLKKAKQRWDDMYAYDHFEMKLDEMKTSRDVESPYQTPYVTRIYYDLKSATNRQRIFDYQFILPHYRSRKFLTSALARYKRFLHLQHSNPGETLVPCFDIALMWQVHMLHPHIYRDDMMALMDNQLPHDGQAILRDIVDRTSEGLNHTADLYRATFGEEYCIPGTGYHGELPTAMVRHDISSFKTDTYEFLMERLEVASTLLTGEFVMAMRIVGGEKVFRRKSSNLVWDSKTGDGIVRFLFRESKKPCLQFKLKVIKLFGYSTVGVATIPITIFLDKSANDRRIEHTTTLLDSKNRHSGVQMSITFRIIPDIGLGFLKLSTGTYSMSEDDGVFGLTRTRDIDKRSSYSGDYNHRVNLRSSMSKKGLTTQHSLDSVLVDSRPLSIGSAAVIHTLLNSNHQIVFTAKVSHNQLKNSSKIEILDHHGSLVALSETIDSRALPNSRQVSDLNPETHCTLQKEDNERAMVIKARNCDWGICFGKWIRESGVEELGHGGFCRPRVSFYGLSRNMERKRTLIERSGFDFRLISVLTLDLRKGHIRFKGSDMSEVPQAVALAFSIALLLTQTSPCSNTVKCEERRSLVHKIMALPMVTSSLY
ncbi:uncharacterized protein [Ptychodera flava]|uniref:uncharacterized protein n=1 Tax=Ptychodera flava TaxID=63121 RepID=UPI00396AA8B8